VSIFCLLWVPSFYLFRRSILEREGTGGVLALLLGSITAIIQFLLGYLVSPGGFGFSRWFFGFIDIVSLPALIPMILYAFLNLVRSFSGDADFTDFALLWIIPCAALRAISWSSTNDPLLLITVPLLWTALAVGIPFFIKIMMSNLCWYTAVISILCILLLPVMAVASYWAFFSHNALFGFLLLFAAHIPFGLSFVFN
jgi:hypothetical protein